MRFGLCNFLALSGLWAAFLAALERLSQGSCTQSERADVVEQP